MPKYFFIGLLLIVGHFSFGQQEISRIWLTFKTNQPTHLVINWESPEPGNSEVKLTIGGKEVYTTKKDEKVILHHVEVPISQNNTEYNYKVITNSYSSEWYSFQGMPSKGPLIIAVIADWGYAVDADISVVLKENPSFIITAGDNVPDLYQYGEEGNIHCIQSYLKLVDDNPELFRSVPFMPALGNHDHQIYPRGKKPPDSYMVYDTLATAFSEFFELPGDEWKWSFTIPDYNIRFLSLDLHHIRDFGNNWQTCPAYHENSEQYKWYKEQLGYNNGNYTVTIYNADNPELRGKYGGIWGDAIENSSLVISGSGYYAEVSIPEKTPYFNSSLIAGNVYPDKLALFSKSVASYVLLTCTGKDVKASLKTLDGNILYETFLESKK